MVLIKLRDKKEIMKSLEILSQVFRYKQAQKQTDFLRTEGLTMKHTVQKL